MGDVILCGDFNARCGTENDFVSNDLDDFIPIDPNYVADNSRIRYSRDSKLDSKGKELLDFCIGNNLRILNGRILGDSLGNFTCFNVHGQSVVDYVIASEEVLSHVLTFKVCSFNHFYLILIVNSFKLLVSYMDSGSTHAHASLKAMPQQYIWNSNSASKFFTYITNVDVSRKLLEFNRSCTNSVMDIENRLLNVCR